MESVLVANTHKLREYESQLLQSCTDHRNVAAGLFDIKIGAFLSLVLY